MKTEQQLGVNFGASAGNFNPADLPVAEVIQAAFAVDESGSISGHEDEISEGIRTAVERWKKSHHSDKILYSQINFSTNIRTLHGYQPIADITPQQVVPDSLTALYDAVYELVSNAISYREAIENTGGEVRTMLFIFTDGHDNNSNHSAGSVKQLINDYFKKNEGAKSTFEVFLFGVGEENYSYFKQAAEGMGIKMLWIDPNDPSIKGKDAGQIIREQVTIVSQSVSSGSTQNLQNLTI